MPEYLAPGVYVEEVSFRSRSIEGVPTSTTGFAGMTRSGPVLFPGGPRSCQPRLITSFTEFERVYGGLETLQVGDNDSSVEERITYTAHAARAFFANGGKRLYVSRVYAPRPGGPDLNGDGVPDGDYGVASANVALDGGQTAFWRARWPGRFGSVRLQVALVRSKNVAFSTTAGLRQARGVRPGAVVEVNATGASPIGTTVPALNTLRVVTLAADGSQLFARTDGATPALGAGEEEIQLLELRVLAFVSPDRVDGYEALACDDRQKRNISRILQLEDPEDENSVIWLEPPTPAAPAAFHAARLMHGLATAAEVRLTGGHDGIMASPTGALGLEGRSASPDVATDRATGLAALDEIDDIAIVALPDGGTYSDVDQCFAAGDALLTHAQNNRFRIAVVDAPEGSSINEIRRFRGRFDSTYGALYHPWIEIFDPLERAAQGAPPRRLLLPPSGFVTGIYARSDIQRGVHKAPANEVVNGLTQFEVNINKGRNDVLNPEGINALRFFPGRGNRVWGARTMSSDPEWKYVNVRRLFIYLEHSIYKGTQWAVFEPNNERLWANIRYAVEDFLLNLWLQGALLGSKPEEAYFVRCDRTTMTQNDIDNGRMVCLVGVSPTKPAEYVIFRIGQWTAESRMS